MNDFLSLLSLALVLIATITPIAITLIKEKAQTARLRMELGSKQSSIPAEAPQIGMTKSRSSPRVVGLGAVFLATVHQAFLVFGPGSAAALSVGDATAIVQSACVFGMGFWLLSSG